MAAKASVRVTAHFEANLGAIREHWSARNAPEALARLVEDIGRAIEALERHPRVGRDFLARSPLSLEARDRAASLREALGGREVREYLAGDDLMLYAFDPTARSPVVHLLAIRHHQQLSFDFEGFWQANREPARRQE